MKSALLIGINYYTDASNNKIRIDGCIDDILNLKTTLMDNLGYDESRIKLLRDDHESNGCLPTRENIIKCLNEIINSDSTELWIHYSGHGSQIHDFNSIKSTEYTDILVPVDYPTAGFISDLDIFEIIRGIPDTKTAMFTFDCCHSGTICDMPWSFEYHLQRDSQTSFIRKRVDNIALSNQKIFVFSGCRDDQTSADSFSRDLGKPMGAFTNALIENLKKGSQPVMILYKNICETLMNEGYPQNPILSSSNMEPDYTIAY